METVHRYVLLVDQ